MFGEKRKKWKVPKSSYQMGSVVYTADLLERALNQYQEYCENEEVPMTIGGFNIFAGIGKDYLKEILGREKLDKKEKARIAVIIGQLKELCETNLYNLALTNQVNPHVAMFGLKHHFKWTDRTQVDQNIQGTQEIQIRILD